MAIAFDASSVGHQDFGGTMTISHTCTGSNLVLVAMAANTSSSDKVSGVTYNGVAMTRVRAELGLVSATPYVYILANPATGTHDIVWTFTSADQTFSGINASFTGVDQTTPTDHDAGGGNGFQNSPRSDNITVSTGGFAVDVIAGSGTSDAMAAGGSQTEIGTQQSTGVRTAASYLQDATAMSWTWSTGQRQAGHSVIALLPASGGGGGSTGTGTLGLLGVGS
jgi:hypothetical protein